MEFSRWVEWAGRLMEAAGVVAMVGGALVALGVLLLHRGHVPGGAYHRFRMSLGRAILLGLELLVAADIIRTVSEKPSMQGVLVLGLIVIIRTFLSFTLTVELEGRWPWQKKEEDEGEDAPARRRPPSPRQEPPPHAAESEAPPPPRH